MDIVVVKGATAAERERMWVTRSDASTDQVPINMLHDLPHLVVESVFGIEFGFWGLIDAGAFAREIRASRAREPKRAKQGRHGVLEAHTDEVMAAKALTNAFRDYGDSSAAAIRKRLEMAAESSAIARAKLERLDDATIEQVLAELGRVHREWSAVPPGGKMQLRWPMAV